MKKLMMLAVAGVVACTVSVYAQAPQKSIIDLNNLDYTVEEAPEWTSLFKRNSGWFGADGIFALPLNSSDKPGNRTKTMLIFSDTLIGEIENDTLPDGFQMVNNTVAFINGDPKNENVQFYYKDAAGKPKTMFVPNTPKSHKGDYYWLGDGFVNPELNNNTYILSYRVRTIRPNDMFGFAVVGSNMIKIPHGSQPPFADQQQYDTPFFYGKPGHSGYLGVGLLPNTKWADVPNPDGYIYVYGLKGDNHGVVAARVKPVDFEKFDQWRYWDGKAWVTDIDKMVPIADRGSNEMSVTPLPDGRYAMIFTVDGVGKYVGMRIGASPIGPFGPIKTIYECKESEIGRSFFQYNAKVHPSLSNPGELLISYNNNSRNFSEDIKEHPQLYRPRFIRVKLQEAKKEKDNDRL